MYLARVREAFCLELLIFRDLILCMRFYFFILSDASARSVSLSSDDLHDDEMVSVISVLSFFDVVDYPRYIIRNFEFGVSIRLSNLKTIIENLFNTVHCNSEQCSV